MKWLAEHTSDLPVWNSATIAFSFKDHVISKPVSKAFLASLILTHDSLSLITLIVTTCTAQGKSSAFMTIELRHQVQVVSSKLQTQCLQQKYYSLHFDASSQKLSLPELLGRLDFSVLKAVPRVSSQLFDFHKHTKAPWFDDLCPFAALSGMAWSVFVQWWNSDEKPRSQNIDYLLHAHRLIRQSDVINSVNLDDSTTAKTPEVTD